MFPCTGFRQRAQSQVKFSRSWGPLRVCKQPQTLRRQTGKMSCGSEPRRCAAARSLSQRSPPTKAGNPCQVTLRDSGLSMMHGDRWKRAGGSLTMKQSLSLSRVRSQRHLYLSIDAQCHSSTLSRLSCYLISLCKGTSHQVKYGRTQGDDATISSGESLCTSNPTAAHRPFP